MALDNTQIAINLAKTVIEKMNLPANSEDAAMEAVLIYTTILNNLPQKPKESKRLTF